MAHLPANTQVHEHSVNELPVMSLPDFIAQLNAWGTTRTPFFFMIDFEMQKPWALPLAALLTDTPVVWFSFPHSTNNLPGKHLSKAPQSFSFEKFPISLSTYQHRFNTVVRHLQAGNSYLVNLTCKTPVQMSCTFHEAYWYSRAKYKVHIPGKLLVFSPETFVTISDNRIRTFPMKGTIDASVPDAASVILTNEKEKAEHVTIVDLLRNDLSMVSRNVKVSRFRYVEEIEAGDKRLLQVSSEICGELPQGYEGALGEILATLLPAGSVSGAPKSKTCEIIREAEGEDRGYFTGVCGIFDGKKLDSAVMIRYIEQTANGIFFRSGGGITSQSDTEQEYHEMLKKVYVPVD